MNRATGSPCNNAVRTLYHHHTRRLEERAKRIHQLHNVRFDCSLSLMLRRLFSTTRQIKMKIVPVPCRSDNYMSVLSPPLYAPDSPLTIIYSPTALPLLPLLSSPRTRSASRYILTDEATGATAVVDPYDPAKLQAAAAKEGISLDNAALLLTHHHEDHSGKPVLGSTVGQARAGAPGMGGRC